MMPNIAFAVGPGWARPFFFLGKSYQVLQTIDLYRWDRPTGN